jgi:hypothetical protein
VETGGKYAWKFEYPSSLSSARVAFVAKCFIVAIINRELFSEKQTQISSLNSFLTRDDKFLARCEREGEILG